MQRKFLNTVLFLTILFYSVPGIAQSGWKLSQDKDGIKVFQSTGGGQGFKKIRVETTMEGNLDKVFALFNNLGHYKDWVYNNKSASLLKRVSPNEFYYYTETMMPWPVVNRDAAVHTKITRNERSLTIDEMGVPNYIPQKQGKVRVPKSIVKWNITKTDPRNIHILYYFEADPGGDLPAWLVNSFADKGPYESFKKLSQILK
jgi:hypothetical protein